MSALHQSTLLLFVSPTKSAVAVIIAPFEHELVLIRKKLFCTEKKKDNVEIFEEKRWLLFVSI